jgi:hypothetical protein
MRLPMRMERKMLSGRSDTLTVIYNPFQIKFLTE